MNPYSGDIEQFSPPREVPEGWLSLTDDEADELERLPKSLRIERYIKAHRTDRCVTCGGFVGNHGKKKFVKCSATELARLDIKRLEDQVNPAVK